MSQPEKEHLIGAESVNEFMSGEKKQAVAKVDSYEATHIENLERVLYSPLFWTLLVL